VVGVFRSWFFLLFDCKEVSLDLGEDHLLQAGQIVKPVTEGLDNCFFKSLLGIGPLQIQEPAQWFNPSATGTLFELFDILIESLLLSKKRLFFLAGTLVGSFVVNFLNILSVGQFRLAAKRGSCRTSPFYCDPEETLWRKESLGHFKLAPKPLDGL
jgi:hypothetical protein